MQDGYGSKKFWFSIGVCIFAFVYALLAATKIEALKPMFDSFTGILEFVTGAYLTGNIANKWVASKKTKKKAPPKDPLDKERPS